MSDWLSWLGTNRPHDVRQAPETNQPRRRSLVDALLGRNKSEPEPVHGPSVYRTGHENTWADVFDPARMRRVGDDFYDNPKVDMRSIDQIMAQSRAGKSNLDKQEALQEQAAANREMAKERAD
eukprot:tig00001027_g6389.t1